MSNKTKVRLFHLCLDHPPFRLLKKMFTSMFEKSYTQNFHSNIFKFAIHHQVSLLLSNKKSSIPFSLIHTDIWGPTKV